MINDMEVITVYWGGNFRVFEKILFIYLLLYFHPHLRTFFHCFLERKVEKHQYEREACMTASPTHLPGWGNE